jgi:hypothetical protein
LVGQSSCNLEPIEQNQFLSWCAPDIAHQDHKFASRGNTSEQLAGFLRLLLFDHHIHRDRSEVKRFIVTRNFVREYKANADLPFPSPLDYNDKYFTDEEVDFFFGTRYKKALRRRANPVRQNSERCSPALPVANRRSIMANMARRSGHW